MNDLEIHHHNKKLANPFLWVLLSFVIIIIAGSILLYFDHAFFAKTAGDPFEFRFEDYINCFFAAVSASCVTGLTPFSNGIVNTFSLFGQIVMIILVQIGGLGFITVLAFLTTLFAGKIKFKDRYFLSQAVGATSYIHVVKFVRQIILISFIVELIGAGLFFPAMFNLYSGNIGQAIWGSIFHSISAFNNAGFDILGNSSYIITDGTLLKDAAAWVPNYIKIVTMVLIIMGGLSFVTIIEIFSFKKRPKQYRAFVKIVLSTSFFLLVGGAITFVSFECFKADNPMSVIDAIFQSVTCRTAGFASYPQGDLTIGSKIISCFLMFVGGSPLGTTGGVKTTTLFIVILSIYSYIRGREVTAFNRRYSQKQIIRAMAIVFIALASIITAFILIEVFESSKGFANEDLVLEVFSAFGTVGLSADLTPQLTIGSKLVLCALMYLGRLGPMTMFSVFSKNINMESKRHYELVEEDILIG